MNLASHLAWPASWPRRISLTLLSLAFTYVGIHHFVAPAFYVSIVPPYLPEPLLLVYVSGFFEVLGGLGILLGRTRRLAGYGLLALLIAVFPANIHMAMNPELYPDLPSAGLYIRLPLQFLAAAWIWWATKTPAEPPA